MYPITHAVGVCELPLCPFLSSKGGQLFQEEKGLYTSLLNKGTRLETVTLLIAMDHNLVSCQSQHASCGK